MIHEISHMKHSNHSSAFYEFMDKLYDEVEDDIANGRKSSTGLLGPSRRLGGSSNNGTAPAIEDRRSLRAAAAEAAARRMRLQNLGLGQVRRLGGHTPPADSEQPAAPADRRALALAAIARRRKVDDLSCPLANAVRLEQISTAEAGLRSEGGKRGKLESENDAVENKEMSKREAKENKACSSRRVVEGARRPIPAGPVTATGKAAMDMYVCGMCTFVNERPTRNVAMDGPSRLPRPSHVDSHLPGALAECDMCESQLDSGQNNRRPNEDDRHNEANDGTNASISGAGTSNSRDMDPSSHRGESGSSRESAILLDSDSNYETEENASSSERQNKRKMQQQQQSLDIISDGDVCGRVLRRVVDVSDYLSPAATHSAPSQQRVTEGPGKRRNSDRTCGSPVSQEAPVDSRAGDGSAETRRDSTPTDWDPCRPLFSSARRPDSDWKL